MDVWYTVVYRKLDWAVLTKRCDTIEGLLCRKLGLVHWEKSTFQQKLSAFTRFIFEIFSRSFSLNLETTCLFRALRVRPTSNNKSKSKRKNSSAYHTSGYRCPRKVNCLKQTSREPQASLNHQIQTKCQQVLSQKTSKPTAEKVLAQPYWKTLSEICPIK